MKLFALALGAVLAAPLQQPVFNAVTRLIVVHATVRNARGELVTTLDRGAFRILENGHDQTITLFRRDDVPVSLGLLIDNSGSMRPLRARVESAAVTLVRASNPDDEVFVVNFNDRVRVDVPITSDREALQRGIARVDSIGGTAMRDAVDTAEAYVVDHGTRRRKVLVVITDGIDNASTATREQIEVAAERRDTVIFAIGLFGRGERRSEGRRELDRLAEKTGGAAFYPENIDQIDATALTIAHQIRSLYTIGYVPDNQAFDGSYRRIQVRVDGPERYIVRARLGYRAVAEPSLSDPY